jgi:hypothetical protein
LKEGSDHEKAVQDAGRVVCHVYPRQRLRGADDQLENSDRRLSPALALTGAGLSFSDVDAVSNGKSVFFGCSSDCNEHRMAKGSKKSEANSLFPHEFASHFLSFVIFCRPAERSFMSNYTPKSSSP